MLPLGHSPVSLALSINSTVILMVINELNRKSPALLSRMCVCLVCLSIASPTWGVIGPTVWPKLLCSNLEWSGPVCEQGLHPRVGLLSLRLGRESLGISRFLTPLPRADVGREEILS